MEGTLHGAYILYRGTLPYVWAHLRVQVYDDDGGCGSIRFVAR